MAPLRFTAVFIFGLIGTTFAQNFYLATPGTFRLNADETIAVALEGNNGSPVEVFIQDHPGKIKNISHTILPVQPDIPAVFKVLLEPNKFPPNFLNSPASPKLVSVTAVSDKFRKEIIVPITTESGYVFIQTDKPIYTPTQRAHMRIIFLNEAAVASDKIFKLQITNPDGIITEEKLFNKKAAQSWKAFETHIYKFPTYPVLGEWSATVRYGHEFQQNTTVRFTLEKYVLPTFTVEVQAPDVILPRTDTFKIGVKAEHVYGKKVQGLVTFRLGVKKDGSQKVIFFATLKPKDLNNGFYEHKIQTNELRKHKEIGWFPEVEGSQLVVEATVTDSATGNNEMATSMKTRFSKSPFVISFKRCLRDFKPGLNSIFEAYITYVDGKPAAGISTKIQAKADGQPLHIDKDSAVSNDDGKVTFEIQPEVKHSTISVTLETTDQKYDGSQAVGTFEQKKFLSTNNGYISIARSTNNRLKPGDMFSKLIHFEPQGIQNIYYMIVSKGKIIAMHKLPRGDFKVQSLKFQITYEMVPSFRLIVFAHNKDEFIADSLKVDVERVCDPKAEVTVEDVFVSKEPGAGGVINIQGSSGTWVGLLGVDEAVYALSRKDLLTKAKMFDKLASHDMGCGPGGGLTVNQVLGNAGVVIGTNKFNPAPEQTCFEIKRRKREAAITVVKTYETKLEQQCCSLGVQHDKYNRTCEERRDVVEKQLEGKYNNCSVAYLECCLHAEKHGITGLSLIGYGDLGRLGGDDFGDLDFITEEDEDLFEKGTLVRSDFRETWIFDDLKIGADGKKSHDVSLPHSITTWVISAVSVSENNGMCVTEPQKIVSFKKIFLHLNLPYSVVKNEQVEVQATLFNYGTTLLPATVYMYGVKDLCTGAQPNQKSERKRLAVKPNSAMSVAFPVIPLKSGTFKIKVVALTPEGSDVIAKDLIVVPEGVPKEAHISIKLDPSNQQRRQKRHLNTKEYSDSIDPSQNLQVTAIKLDAPKGFVPGTASCSISAMGDQMGPVVETAINNPEGLLRKPYGCGEQNMMFLAPTLYTMRYLKATGKLSAESEDKGYAFIRTGYGNELAFRKQDGSYAAYQSKPTSTWLTAFVMKVFCQANELVHIDENVLCSGIRWLINNQEPDGSYIEKSPVYHLDMMGGVQGSTPLTAFALIALEECKCDEEADLLLAKQRAIAYLEAHLGDVTKPLPVAIVAYALALGDSELKQTAFDKLLALAKTNEDENLMYWETENSAQDIETAGYGLLTHLHYNDMTRSSSIVNWLNKKQLQSGSFKSTQDTVVALQSLSEYAIRAQMPAINLVSNITSSNDRLFHRVLTFHEDNALILQDVKVDKIGGTLFINTVGHGVGSLAVKLRYNLIVPPEEICKFDIKVEIKEPKKDENDNIDAGIAGKVGSDGIRNNDVFDNFPPDLIRGVLKALDDEIPLLEVDPRNRGRAQRDVDNSQVEAENEEAKSRVRRQNKVENSKLKYIVSVCVRKLGDKDAEMSIVDVGIFSGFLPETEKLKQLEDDPNHLIERYETSSRGVVFYLRRVPIANDYCFSFPVVREYIVGNTQMSVVKVYDYYNPDEACTKFYSPDTSSPILHTICKDGTCSCAEGGCPNENAFAETADLSRDQKRKRIMEMACDNYDYVWKGKLAGPIKKHGGFLNISFTVDEVIKEGIEKRDLIEGEVRTLLARDNCPVMFPGQTYLILGKDGQQYMNSEGVAWYQYLLDQTSFVHMWTSIPEARDQELQRALVSMTNNVAQKGCLS